MRTLKNILLISVLTLSVNLFWACDDGGDKKENSVTLCTDGVDNDGDDLIDCLDPNCETACASLDADEDGVPDHLDVCPGFDDALDADNDSVPDGCDICTNGQDLVDYDQDGVPDDCDACEGYDDALDADEDGVPDGCDLCPDFDDNIDSDGDTIPDECDICANGDDTVDTDGDGTPDDCDDCPLTVECNICYEACYYIEQSCGYANACAASGFDCTTEDDFCESACMLDATCAAIATMISQNPDPDLSACINACDPNNACTTCTASSCQGSLNACYQDTACTAFMTCSETCLDAACVETCASANPSTATTNLRDCTCTNCSTDCTNLCVQPN